MLDRYGKYEWTEEDIKTMHSRMIGEGIGVIPPNVDGINGIYECSTNKQRNVTATTIFQSI